MPESWEQVARALAARLVHHARCPEPHKPGSDPCCPFCEDVRAYKRYLVKVRQS